MLATNSYVWSKAQIVHIQIFGLEYYLVICDNKCKQKL